MAERPLYVYIVCAQSDKRSHAKSVAERVRFSVESMMHPVFLATEKNASRHRAALESADVLLLTDAQESALQDAWVREALDVFSKKSQGRIVVYAKNMALAKKIEGAAYVRESAGAHNELLRTLLLLSPQQDETQDMPEQEQQPAGKFDNVKNIVFICAFLAVVCILLRVVLSLLK